MMKTILTLFSLALISIAPGLAAGDEPKEKPRTQPANLSPEEKAIWMADDSFVRAYNAGDAKALAALFTEDAEASDARGDVVKGRDAITALFAAIFEESPGSKLEVTVDSLRFPTADVALETGRTIVTPADGGAPERGRYTVLFVKKDGKWLQSFVQESSDDQITPHERLKELAWMIGDWVDESESAVASTSCRWSDDKNFLLRDFTIHVAGAKVMSGTQRIGWDPLTGQIKSWIFESDGGHAEGLWSRLGNQWVVKVSGSLPDGQRTTATQVITYVNKETIRWKAVDRTIGATIAPDIDEIAMVKKPPKPR